MLNLRKETPRSLVLTFVLIVKTAAIKTATACLKLRLLVLYVRSIRMFILVFITFGSFVVCFDVSPLIKQRIKSLEKKNKFIGNSQVKTWSNWFVLPHMIQYSDFPNYLLPELSCIPKFVFCCQHKVTHSDWKWQLKCFYNTLIFL